METLTSMVAMMVVVRVEVEVDGSEVGVGEKRLW